MMAAQHVGWGTLCRKFWLLATSSATICIKVINTSTTTFKHLNQYSIVLNTCSVLHQQMKVCAPNGVRDQCATDQIS